MKYALITNNKVTKITYIDCYDNEVYGVKMPSTIDIMVGDDYIEGSFYRDGVLVVDKLAQALAALAEANKTIEQLRVQVNEIGKTELNGTGSQEDPLELEIGMELVPNAYYTYEGAIYVYMGRPDVATEDNMPTGDEEVDFVNHWASI